MRWMWIDQIVEFVAEKKLVAIKNVSLAEEHVHDYPARQEPAEAGSPDHLGHPDHPGVMPASLMIEGMAQTAGILVGSVHHFREKVILAKIVIARFDCEVVPGETIRYEAHLDSITDQGA